MSTDSAAAPAVEQTDDVPFEGGVAPETEANDGIPRANPTTKAPAEPELAPMTMLTIESVKARIKQLDQIRDQKLEAAVKTSTEAKLALDQRQKEERSKERAAIEETLRTSKAAIRNAYKEAMKSWRQALRGLEAEATIPRDLSEDGKDTGEGGDTRSDSA